MGVGSSSDISHNYVPLQFSILAGTLTILCNRHACTNVITICRHSTHWRVEKPMNGQQLLWIFPPVMIRKLQWKSKYVHGQRGRYGRYGLGHTTFWSLTISRCGLYSGGGVAPTWCRSSDVNVVHACSSKRPAAHVSLSWNFLTSCLLDSFFHSEPSV